MFWNLEETTTSKTMVTTTEAATSSIKRKVSLSPETNKVPPAKKARTTKSKLTEEEALNKAVGQVSRKLQAQIKSKLEWKNSFRALKNGATRGARVEVTCNDPKVFEEIFKFTTVKKTKDRLSCSLKTEDEVDDFPFSGKSYRYNTSVLTAPISASLKENTLTLSFKFTIY